MEDIISELKIVLHKDGHVSVTGALGDRFLCYGMLEMAKEVIVAAKTQATIIRMPDKEELLNGHE